jgi:predicted transcriptional regulator
VCAGVLKFQLTPFPNYCRLRSVSQLEECATDLKVLDKHGLVTFHGASREHQGASKAPEVPYREIALRIAI